MPGGPMSKPFFDKIKKLPDRLLICLGCYLVLILVGLYVLLPVETREERFILGIFLAVFAILIVKSIVHSKQEDE
jgi:hypothetical protein